jgi:transcriptional regulator with XRE-family HTH domain
MGYNPKRNGSSFPKNLGRNIRKAMKHAGIHKQKDLAEMTDTSPPYISQLLAGKKGIDAVNIPKFSQVLGVSPAFFFLEGLQTDSQIDLQRDLEDAYGDNDQESIEMVRRILKNRKKIK